MTDLNNAAASWPSVPLWERFETCRTMLLIHGLLSDGESDRVKKRLDKMADKQGLRRLAPRVPQKEGGSDG